MRIIFIFAARLEAEARRHGHVNDQRFRSTHRRGSLLVSTAIKHLVIFMDIIAALISPSGISDGTLHGYTDTFDRANIKTRLRAMAARPSQALLRLTSFLEEVRFIIITGNF